MTATQTARDAIVALHGAIQHEHLWRALPGDDAEMTRRVEAYRRLYNHVRPQKGEAGWV